VYLLKEGYELTCLRRPMKNDKITQLSQLIDKRTDANIYNTIYTLFISYYEKKYFRKVKKCFSLVKKLYEGSFPGYRACTTDYHDFEHVMDVFLLTGQLVDGYNSAVSVLDVNPVVNLLIASLLHDVGYIQEEWDTEGTGAKYTHTHVERGIYFLKKFHKEFELSQHADIEDISSMILCTKTTFENESIAQCTEAVKIAGSMLGTADLLGQMASRIYLEKLLFLYYEFREANMAGFTTEFDVLRQTSDFYLLSRKKLSENYMNMYIYVEEHLKKRYNINRNLYIEAIEKQMHYLDSIIEDDTTNFRHKLKRGKLRDPDKN
jgi:hypothetical protein